MMSFALKYREPIDAITADKELKLRKYELDNDDWKIIADLVAVLEVSPGPTNIYTHANILNSNTKMQLCFSRATRPA